VLVSREVVKAAVVHTVGVFAAYTAESVAQANHQLVSKFAAESKRQSAARADMRRLMLNTLPEPVYREIAEGGWKAKCAHRYSEVTVLQADMVGFTALAAKLEASSLLALLGELFTDFDELSEKLHVHKLKTIGDAYVAPAARIHHPSLLHLARARLPPKPSPPPPPAPHIEASMPRRVAATSRARARSATAPKTTRQAPAASHLSAR
jgi:class 3 adenylate cyclase